MNPETALYQLRNFPEEFLGNHIIFINGAPNSAIYNDYSFARSQNVSDNGMDMFQFGVGPIEMDSATTVDVQNVRMIRGNEPGVQLDDLECYQVDDTPGSPDILITGQLSGCSFPVLQHGGHLYVSHAEPGDASPGQRPHAPELRNQLDANGAFHGFAGQAFTNLFGAGNATDNQHYDYNQHHI